MTDVKFVVLGKNTHFEYGSLNSNVFCTHGGWGGKLELLPDDKCQVVVAGMRPIQYESYVFTDAASYDKAYSEGLIT